MNPKSLIFVLCAASVGCQPGFADARKIQFELNRGFNAYFASVFFEGLECVDDDANVFLGRQVMTSSAFSGCKGAFFSASVNSAFFEDHKSGADLLLRMVEPAGTVEMTLDQSVAPLTVVSVEDLGGEAAPRDNGQYLLSRWTDYRVIVAQELGTQSLVSLEYNGPQGAAFGDAQIDTGSNAILFELPSAAERSGTLSVFVQLRTGPRDAVCEPELECVQSSTWFEATLDVATPDDDEPSEF